MSQELIVQHPGFVSRVVKLLGVKVSSLASRLRLSEQVYVCVPVDWLLQPTTLVSQSLSLTSTGDRIFFDFLTFDNAKYAGKQLVLKSVTVEKQSGTLTLEGIYTADTALTRSSAFQFARTITTNNTIAGAYYGEGFVLQKNSVIGIAVSAWTVAGTVVMTAAIRVMD